MVAKAAMYNGNPNPLNPLSLGPYVRQTVRLSVRLSGKITFVHTLGLNGPSVAAKGCNPPQELDRGAEFLVIR